MREAAAIRDRLAQALETAPVVELDCGAVTEADAVGLQLLCSAARSAAEAGGSLALLEVSAPLREALELTGLTHALQGIMPGTTAAGPPGQPEGADG
jgi:anti-anti-sigma factor